MNKILKGFISVVSGSIIILLIAIIYNPVLVRISGKIMYGQIANFLAIYIILSIINQFGMIDAVRKFVSENINNEEKEREVILTSLIIPSVIGLIFALIMILIFNFLVKINLFSNISFSTYIVLILSLLPLNIWISVKSTLFSYHKEGKSTRIEVLREVINKSAILLLIFSGLGLVAIPLSFLIANIFAVFMGLFSINREIYSKFARSEAIDFDFIIGSIIPVVKFGGLSLLGILSAQLLYKMDIILVNYFLGNSQTAIYKVALVLAEMLWLIPKAMQGVLFHNSSELWAKNDKTNLIDLGNKFLLYNSLVLTLLSTGLFVLAKPFISLYFGPDYVNAVISLRILIAGSFLFGISRILSSILKGTEWIKNVEYITFFVSLLNIILNIILIPRFGINGAAIATSFTYGLILAGNLAIMKICKVDLKFSFPYLKIIVLLVSFFLIYQGLFNLFNIEGILDICFMALSGLIIFTILVISLGLFSGKELRIVKSFFTR